jgi:predicted MFS family arabinose efflux permease
MSNTARTSFRRIAPYFVTANIAVWLGNPTAGVANVPIQTFLKDSLHLEATPIGVFNFVVSIPMFAGALFGLVRDRWSPFGMRDRGYFLLFGAIAVALFLALAAAPKSYGTVLAGVFAITLAYRFLTTSKEALTARVGRLDGLTDRLSALSNGVGGLVIGVSFIIGGNVEGESRIGGVLAASAALTAVFLLLGAWRVRAVFAGDVEAPVARAKPWSEARRLLSHRPFRLAVVIWLITQFTPTLLTPLLFHFTRDLHGGADDYGLFMGIFFLGFAPLSLLYGLLAKRVRFKTLLVVGLVLIVPQMLPLLFLDSAAHTVMIAPVLSALGVIATCAGYDLLLRTCPSGLEGTGMMLADTAFWVSWKLGDVVGAWLYDRGGFAPTIWLTTAVYALALFVGLRIPREAVEGKA